jgi:hypothetical protein
MDAATVGRLSSLFMAKKTKAKVGKKKAAQKKKPAPRTKKTKKSAVAKKKSAVAKKKGAATKKKGAVAKKKAAPKKAAPKRKPIKRRDATGHLDPSYARDLHRRSLENAEHDDDRGFLVGKNSDDALAEELGREFVETVTSGEDEGTELRDGFVTEEVGGPFVTTTRGQEVDDKPDESNPQGATREPFPKT